MINMTIAELKRLISDLPDNMPVIIPVWEMRYDNASKCFQIQEERTL